MRDSIVIYRSLREATKQLDLETRAKVYDAVMDYAFDGTEPDETGVVQAMFLMIKPIIDLNNQRYENGRKGGRPKNQTETKTKPKNNQNETKPKPNVNVNDNVNVNINNTPYISPFNEFWENYPKQRAGNKGKAYKAFCRAITEKRATPEQIVQASKVYATSDEVEKGFAKGAEAWLNDDRFNNDYSKPKTKQEIAFEKAYNNLQELYREDVKEVAYAG